MRFLQPISKLILILGATLWLAACGGGGGGGGIAFAYQDLFGFAHLTIDRRDHTATLLDDGTVLITGGKTTINVNTTLDSAEVYDPTTRLFSPLASTMISVRRDHTATLLNDNRVLIIGGKSDFPTLETFEYFF